MKIDLKLILILFVSMNCYGFDESDSGEFQILSSSNGQPLSRGFAISKIDSKWAFFEQTESGDFVQRPCVGECEFKNSSETDMRRMFRNGELNILENMACIENNAFALCSFLWPEEKRKGYVMVGFSENGPKPMALRYVGKVEIRKD